MKVAAVQFAPRLGELKGNIRRADSLLEDADLEGVQLLVLPELALTGYNFPNLNAISDYLEPTCAGPTAWWAAQTAKLHGLTISIGYPEITMDPKVIPSKITFTSSKTIDEAIQSARGYVTDIKARAGSFVQYWMFNSTLTVKSDGSVVAHYRKTHLYYSDVPWASPSIEGFNSVNLSFADQQIKASFAICMDLNPKAFTASWKAYEVARNSIASDSSLLLVSTAWMTNEEAVVSDDDRTCCPKEVAQVPDMDTLLYWLERLTPLMEQNRDTLVVISNRTGNEKGLVKACNLEKLIRPVFEAGQVTKSERTSNPKQDDMRSEDAGTTVEQRADQDFSLLDKTVNINEASHSGIVSTSAHYAGTSTILRMGHGKVSVLGVLGRGEERVLIADTTGKAVMTFKRRDAKAQEEEEEEEEEEAD